MITTLETVTQSLQRVFTQTADTVARTTQFVQRESKLTGPLFVQTLTFGWLHRPEATLQELAQTAASLGLSISPQGLDQRFGPRAADFLLAVLQDAVLQVVTADPVAIPILQRFPGGVCLLDSTTLTLPDALADHWRGCGGTTSQDGQAALRAQVRLNLLNGALTGPFLQPGRVPDQQGVLQNAPLPPQALRLADLGFFGLETFAALSQQGVYWLSRWQLGTALLDAAGTKQDLLDVLSRQPGDAVDLPFRLGVQHGLPCRLLAVRVPPEVVQLRRQRLRKKAQKKCCRVSSEQWALAAWNVFVTNVPQERLSVAEALVLARCRWQIELLFKLWKSEGRIDESRSDNPWRVLCEVYAKLLGMVVQHWLLLVSCWQHADRSLVKASRTVRTHVRELAVVLSHGHLVRRTMMILQKELQRGCRINRRRRAPPTFQLLLNLPKAG